VISLPARVYPSGYLVDCDGCQYHDDANFLIVDTPPTGDPATISIHP